MREARIHVRHIRDLLKGLDPSDAYNGVDCNSLSFLSVFTDGDLGGVCVCVPICLFACVWVGLSVRIGVIDISVNILRYPATFVLHINVYVCVLGSRL